MTVLGEAETWILGCNVDVGGGRRRPDDQSGFRVNDIVGVTSTGRLVNSYRGWNERVSAYKKIRKGPHLPGGDALHLDALSIEVKTLSPVEIKERARVNSASRCFKLVLTRLAPSRPTTLGAWERWNTIVKATPGSSSLRLSLVESKHGKVRAPPLEFTSSFLLVSLARDRRLAPEFESSLGFHAWLTRPHDGQDFCGRARRSWVRGRKRRDNNRRKLYHQFPDPTFSGFNQTHSVCAPFETIRVYSRGFLCLITWRTGISLGLIVMRNNYGKHD